MSKVDGIRKKPAVAHFTVSVGGVKKHILEFAEHFDRDRLEVEGIFPDRAISSTLASNSDVLYRAAFSKLNLPCHVLEIPRPLSIRDPLWVWRLFLLLRRIRPDVLHCHSSKAGYIGRLAALFTRTPVCYTPHMMFYLIHRGLKRKMLFWAEWFLGFFTDAIIAVSQSEKEELERNFPRFRGKIVRINNGIRPPPAPRDPDEVRRAYGIPAGAPLILSPARCEPQKDVKTLVMAMKQVADDVPGAILLVAGDGALKPGLEALSASLGLEENIRFLGWVDDLEPLLSAADIVILSSRSEGLPYVVLEASAIGKPVIGSDVMGIRDAIRDGETGCLLPQGDVEGFADQITRLCRDPELRTRMGEAGRKMVEKDFSVSGMVASMEELYARLAR